MSSDFKLIAAGLVDVRAAKNIEALDACGQRDRTSDNSTGSLAGINNFKSRLIVQFVIKCLEANKNPQPTVLETVALPIELYP